MQISRRLSVVLLIITAVALIAAVKPLVKIGTKTHLGVPVGSIVYLQTADSVTPDNSFHTFIYDNGPAFSVPKGYSFVVTDIIAYPDTTTVAASDKYLLFIGIGPGGSRGFTAIYSGIDDRHYSFATGFVIPSETTPNIRNVGSTRPVRVQMLGYFVEGKGITENTSAFEEP